MASSNGDCIHVDFNCLFNKGETLGVPEIVPFRLTHNMIEAMGPLGYEGIYRKTCEVALKILRDYKEPLITILKTFIYDPLVEWKTPANAKTNETGETISAKVLTLDETLKKLKKHKFKYFIYRVKYIYKI
jgi:serine/threonine-protein kinase ATR